MTEATAPTAPALAEREAVAAYLERRADVAAAREERHPGETEMWRDRRRQLLVLASDIRAGLHLADEMEGVSHDRGDD